MTACLRRWWHCLWRFHRPVDHWTETLAGECVRIVTCECGHEFGRWIELP